MAYHSPRSPSTIHRWIRCWGAPQAEAALPDFPSEAAAKGTFFHKVAADCLTAGLDARDFYGRKAVVDGFSFTFDEEMGNHMQPGLDWVRAQPGNKYIEQRVSLDHVMPGESGTMDVGIYDWSSVGDGLDGPPRVVVFDWKYGFYEVEAEGNEQEMAYAIGFLNMADRYRAANYDKIHLVIEQPRIQSEGSEHVVTIDELNDFETRLADIFPRTFEPDAPRTAGPVQCKWCRAKSTCPEFARYNLETIGAKFDAIDMSGPPALIEPKTITPEMRSYILLRWPLMEAWHRELELAALNDALKGLPTPGLKAVIGRRPARKWVDQETAAVVLNRELGAKAYTIELISPTEMEKLVTVDEYKRITKEAKVDLGEGKPVLVEITNNKPAIKSLDAKFDALQKD